MNRNILYVLVGALVVAAGGILIVSRRVIRPLQVIRGAMVKVADIMTRDVVTVSPSAPIHSDSPRCRFPRAVSTARCSARHPGGEPCDRREQSGGHDPRHQH